MIIKAVKLYDNGFMTQALAMGGEGMDGIDPAAKYRSSLQNYVIDTGDEVILVDTGMPAEVPEQVPDEKTIIYMGKKVNTYVAALAEAGYQPEQVDKILITHKHADLGAFTEDAPVEHAVDDVAHGARRDEGDAKQHPELGVFLRKAHEHPK